MKIETIKDLEAVLKLCRKMHIVDISIDNVQCKLGDMPEKATISQNETLAVAGPSQEDLMFWSSGGING